MTTRAGIYVRISLDRDGLSASPERQRQDATKLCEGRGWKVEQVYEDRDVSAFKAGVKRPAYERLLADVAAGVINAVVVWKMDRLSRSVRDFTTTLEFLAEHQADLASVNDPVDTTTAMGKAMLQIGGVFAELESATIGTRVRRAQQQAAEQGRWHTGGHRSFGYTRGGEVVQEEAALVQEAAQSIVDGNSMWSICERWNADGIRTSAGNAWTTASMGQMFRSVKLAGFRKHKEEIYKGEWEAILPLETFAAVGEQLSHGKEMTKRRVKRHLLTGLLKCDKCGAALQRRVFTQSNGTKFERYQCVKEPGRPNCGGTAVAMLSADAVVTAKVLARYSHMDAHDVATPSAERMAELEAQLSADGRDLEQVTHERFIERSIPEDVYQSVRRDLAQRIVNAEAERERLVNTDTTVLPTEPEELEAWWITATQDERRRAIERLVEEIRLIPAVRRGGNRFDGERLKIRWKQSP